jgi:hypothetical protein
MEAVGEVKGERRDDHQHEDYIVTHANSVSTREVAVETPKQESSNGHPRFREGSPDNT